MRLGNLRPEDVAVQLIFGDVDDKDRLHNIRKYPTTPVGSQTGSPGSWLRFPPSMRGRVGCLARMVPSHPLLASDPSGLSAVIQ